MLGTSLDNLNAHYKLYKQRTDIYTIKTFVLRKEAVTHFAEMALAIFKQSKIITNLFTSELTPSEIIAISETVLANRRNIIRRNITGIFDVTDRSIRWKPVTEVEAVIPDYGRRVGIVETQLQANEPAMDRLSNYQNRKSNDPKGSPTDPDDPTCSKCHIRWRLSTGPNRSIRDLKENWKCNECEPLSSRHQANLSPS